MGGVGGILLALVMGQQMRFGDTFGRRGQWQRFQFIQRYPLPLPGHVSMRAKVELAGARSCKRCRQAFEGNAIASDRVAERSQVLIDLDGQLKLLQRFLFDG